MISGSKGELLVCLLCCGLMENTRSSVIFQITEILHTLYLESLRKLLPKLFRSRLFQVFRSRVFALFCHHRFLLSVNPHPRASHGFFRYLKKCFRVGVLEHLLKSLVFLGDCGLDVFVRSSIPPDGLISVAVDTGQDR